MRASLRLLICTLVAVGWTASTPQALGADDATPKASQEDLKKEFEAAKAEAKAEKGDPWARYSLAGCYAKGAGVETNNTEAVAWFILAMDKLPMAALARVEAEKKMSPGQIRTGWLRAKELRATIDATMKAAAKWLAETRSIGSPLTA